MLRAAGRDRRCNVMQIMASNEAMEVHERVREERDGGIAGVEGMWVERRGPERGGGCGREGGRVDATFRQHAGGLRGQRAVR